jgi:hypothetical protein
MSNGAMNREGNETRLNHGVNEGGVRLEGVFRGLLETLASGGALTINRETLEELEKVYLEEKTELNRLLEYIDILRHGLNLYLTEDEIEEARARASKELGMELEKTIGRGLFGETIEYGVPRCVYVYLKALADVIERRALKRINEEIVWVLENLGELKKKQDTQG